jgi:hypothetical protein
MGKVNDFGGIPASTYSKILAFLSPPVAGVDKAVAATALGQLVRERHAALLPGDGRTGFVEAYKAFEELDAAIAEVQGASAPTIDGAVKKLGDAVDVIAHLWANGPVANEFFSEKGAP